jgi:uncharacterized membrane protein
VTTITDNSPVVTGRGRIALPVSLVLNLFLLALIGGHVWHNRLHVANSDRPLARALADVEASLSTRDGAAFKAAIVADQPRFAEAAKKSAQARLELGRQITAVPFDPKATQRALEAWRTSWNAFMADFDEPLVHALTQISPEGRQKLVLQRRERLAPVTP